MKVKLIEANGGRQQGINVNECEWRQMKGSEGKQRLMEVEDAG